MKENRKSSYFKPKLLLVFLAGLGLLGVSIHRYLSWNLKMTTCDWVNMGLTSEIEREFRSGKSGGTGRLFVGSFVSLWLCAFDRGENAPVSLPPCMVMFSKVISVGRSRLRDMTSDLMSHAASSRSRRTSLSPRRFHVQKALLSHFSFCVFELIALSAIWAEPRRALAGSQRNVNVVATDQGDMLASRSVKQSRALSGPVFDQFKHLAVRF